MLLDPSSFIYHDRFWRWLCVAVALLTGLLYFLNLQQEHDWGGDFSQYIAHARNMAEGVPYKATNHLQSSELTIAPETYPVVFPLLLAPVYALFGVDLVAFKVVVVLCFVGFLLMLWPVFRPHLPAAAVFFVTVLLAANPSFYLFKEHILSEFPFLFFLFVCLYFMQRAFYAANAREARLFYGLAGLGLFLLVGTRSLGMVMVPAWIGGMVFLKAKPRRWLLYLGFSLLVFAIFYLLQKIYLNSIGESYGDQFLKMYQDDTISSNLKNYFNEAKLLWLEGANGTIKLTLLILLLILSAIGLVLRCIRQRPGVFEFFTLGSVALTLIWPYFQGFRMLIPFIPLLFFFAFYAVNAGINLRPNVALGVLAVLFVLFLFPYFRAYRKIETTVPFNFVREETKEMFAFIRRTPTEGRVLFIKPRVLALYTGHAAMVSHCPETPETFAGFLAEHQITYLVVSKKDFAIETKCLNDWARQHPDKARLQFENDGFAVFQRIP